MLEKIKYRIERIFKGERGVVESVEELDETELLEQETLYKRDIFYGKDYSGNLPQLITLRNPLGELVTRFAPLTLTTTIQNPITNEACCMDERYKTYKPGDIFP